MSKQDTLTFKYQVLAFKALTHPARLAILEILRDDEHCVCHMEAHLGYRQAYISQQLSVLREAGIIQDRRDGWNIFYSVADKRIYDVLDAMYQLTGTVKLAISHPKTTCCCPHCAAEAESTQQSRNLQKKEKIMLNIKILGSGCANCKRLEQLTRKAVESLGIEAEFEKVTDFNEIMKYPIVSTPGLVINNKVVSSGRIPAEGEISGWLTQA